MIDTYFLRGIAVTAEKNMRIYYRKAPVVIFGLLFPLFMFVAFFIGRELEIDLFFPAFLAMTLFFTSSSVGPLITPWEKQARTFERLLSYPLTVGTLILGDMAAGMLFGAGISVLVLLLGVAFVGIGISSVVLFLVALLLGAICFASMGVLLAAPASSSPSNIMMLSSLIRFPLIFISGIFIPLGELEGLRLAVSYASPLTYLVDAMNHAAGGPTSMHVAVDIVVLIVVSAIFLIAATAIQKRSLTKGL